MESPDRMIWNKFHIKRRDNLPYTGWHGGGRDRLAELFNDLGYREGVEVGTMRGLFAQVLCERIPNVHLTCVDPWVSYREAGRPSQKHMNQHFAHAKAILAPYNVTFCVKPSLEAVNDFADGSLDFVYIDAMHEFDHVMRDILAWVPKVRTGGIISGHDFNHSYQQGVVQAVEAYTHAHNLGWYITGYEVVLPNGRVEPVSWFWLQP